MSSGCINIQLYATREKSVCAKDGWLQPQIAHSLKYFLGKLHETRGESEFVHTLRFMTDGDPDKYLDDVASRFYDDDGGDEEDGGYSFDGGGIVIKPGVCREIPKDFYIQCHEYGAVTGV